MGDGEQRRIGVVGLGYVGLPVAVAFAERFEGTVGFDIDGERVEQLRQGHDVTDEVGADRLRSCGLTVSSDVGSLCGVDFFVVTVPTPIDADNRPDLRALRAASESVGSQLSAGAIVVYESTVYPGVTEEICGPILERASGLRCGVDFKLGYSPERINPGDREHSLERITKVVAGQDEASLDTIADVYARILEADVHRAPDIKTAEAAKVIENTQRDLNIALMNELAIIFDQLDIDTQAVLDAAATKWNFLRFTPGLVGGHCIGVDPYYLTARAEQIGVHPQVILAGRRINDGMGKHVADKAIKLLVRAGVNIIEARVLVLGITFKENVPDIRNSGVVSIVRELEDYGAQVTVADPRADSDEVREEYGIELTAVDALESYHAVVFAVPHEGLAPTALRIASQWPSAVLIDVKGAIDPARCPEKLHYWRL